MTIEEKEICAELFLAFTNDNEMPSHRWNDKAAVELYRMIRVLKNCSTGMSWIISLPVIMPQLVVLRLQELHLNICMIYGKQKRKLMQQHLQGVLIHVVTTHILKGMYEK
ncbi:MAG: hypothetical protein ACKE51_03515 [Methylococcaceae bacterium]